VFFQFGGRFLVLGKLFDQAFSFREVLQNCFVSIVVYLDMEGDHASAKFEGSILPPKNYPSEKNDHPRLMNIIESKPHPNGQPHPKLWFDDGSLVIQASSIRYRIHRTIICQHSAIFRDMMAMPQPNDGSSNNENTFDACLS
jgi:hypothetical protein